MSKLSYVLEAAGYDNPVISEKQLTRLIDGGAARRYGLVNRALRDGALTRIKRGLYALSAAETRQSLHPFVVAQYLAPGSYVSFESALSHHGWIPEAVYTTACVAPGRKSKEYETDMFGQFSFHPLATEPYQFLVSVDRVLFGTSASLIASPLRALMDLVARRKIEWTGLGWVEAGLRIDRAALEKLRRSDFSRLRSVYKHKRVREFLIAFEQALIEHKAAHARQEHMAND